MTPLSGLYQLAPNKMEQFAFIDMLFHFVWISPKGNHLQLWSLQHDTIQLEHITGHLFRADERVQASHVFYQSKAEYWMLSNGYKTYKKSSEFLLICYWLSLFFGVLGFFYLLVISIIRILKKQVHKLNPIKWVIINLSAFTLPLFAYSSQSFLAFGDKTIASISLAILTGILPFTLSFTLLKCCLQGTNSNTSKNDIFAMVMLLQLCLVLFAWGLLPAIYWQ